MQHMAGREFIAGARGPLSGWRNQCQAETCGSCCVPSTIFQQRLTRWNGRWICKAVPSYFQHPRTPSCWEDATGQRKSAQENSVSSTARAAYFLRGGPSQRCFSKSCQTQRHRPLHTPFNHAEIQPTCGSTSLYHPSHWTSLWIRDPECGTSGTDPRKLKPDLTD